MVDCLTPMRSAAIGTRPLHGLLFGVGWLTLLRGLRRSITCRLFDYDDMRESICYLEGDATILGAPFGSVVAGDRPGLTVSFGRKGSCTEASANQVRLYGCGAPLGQTQVINFSPD